MDYPDISDELPKAMEKADALHGHMCPSLYYGITVSLVALKLAAQHEFSPVLYEFEGKTDCFKDGIRAVFGDTKVEELPLTGRTTISLSNGETGVHVEILEEVKKYVNELKVKVGKENFLDKGMEYLTSLKAENFYRATVDSKAEKS